MNERTQINTLNTVNFAAMRVIREAFDDAVKEIETRRGKSLLPSDDTRAKVARQILNLARGGERDAIRLREGALSALHIV
ncbi:MAG: hypothetical protein GC190_19070 [Alphaproteobacteria bacterium]|nr:hypothetical protein [Alphaproteobacteria bacterium]